MEALSAVRPTTDSKGQRTPGGPIMFVGAQREQTVTDLVAAFDRIRTTMRPELVVLESETGLGKTRILQEFYARLARDRQGTPPYWPSGSTRRPPATSSAIASGSFPRLPFTIPGGAPLPYLWWGIVCEDDESGVAVPRLLDSAAQFEIHARHLTQQGPRPLRHRPDSGAGTVRDRRPGRPGEARRQHDRPRQDRRGVHPEVAAKGERAQGTPRRPEGQQRVVER